LHNGNLKQNYLEIRLCRKIYPGFIKNNPVIIWIAMAYSSMEIKKYQQGFSTKADDWTSGFFLPVRIFLLLAIMLLFINKFRNYSDKTSPFVKRKNDYSDRNYLPDFPCCLLCFVFYCPEKCTLFTQRTKQTDFFPFRTCIYDNMHS